MKAYRTAINNININIKHKTINHFLNIVDPNDSTIHTQNIERLWSRAKYFLRKNNRVNKEKIFLSLVQFMWNYKIEKKRFNEVLCLLCYNYKI